MIEAQGLRKSYGGKIAVDDLSFTVQPGLVTGFLGPNGSGKSTTMRLILGLDHPDAGQALVDGRPYATHANPLGAVGALLDAKAVHPGRTARQHLLAQAATAAIPRSRVDHVIDLVGLREVASRRAGGFSLGMGQRLGIAGALLGDPATVMFDEPVNGLDPDGILWVRNLMKALAAEGRAVFVSSHLMSEMALTADRLVVIGRGRLIAETSVAELVDRSSGPGAVVRTPQADQLRTAVAMAGGTTTDRGDGTLQVLGLPAAQVGELAARHQLVLHELVPQRATLEEAFMALTAADVEYRAAEPTPSTGVDR